MFHQIYEQTKFLLWEAAFPLTTRWLKHLYMKRELLCSVTLFPVLKQDPSEVNGKCGRRRKGGIEIGRGCGEDGAKCELVKRGRSERRGQKTTP